MSVRPLDPYSELVDVLRRTTPEWYTFFTELSTPLICNSVDLPGPSNTKKPLPSVGDRAFITDGASTTFMGTISGGGSTLTPVYWDGVTWRNG